MKKVLIYGIFNVLHPGHLRFIRFAKECGDYLIVGVKSDSLAKPWAHLSEGDRLEAVKSISWVDDVFLWDKDIIEYIDDLKPEIVVKGKEFECLDNPESPLIESYGGKLIFSSGETIFSSLQILKNEINSFDHSNIKIPKDYLIRHEIKKESLRKILHKFAKLKICVIGDLIVDEYITCDPLGMSQEDPTLVVTPIDSSLFIGGAAIVAAHASELGAETHFVSICGDDIPANFALENLDKFNVIHEISSDPGRPTTLKQRYRCKGKTLLRVSKLHQGSISQSLQDKIFERLASLIKEIDLIVFSDFNYGALPQPLVARIIDTASQHQVLVTADSQSSSQHGDVSRFKGASLICPTEREARLATRNYEDGLVILAEELRRLTNANYVMLKLGQEGLLTQCGYDKEEKWVTDRIDALNSNPRDVAGAGDSMLIVASLSLAAGANIWEASLLGSMAAAVQISRIGNLPINKDEIYAEIEKI